MQGYDIIGDAASMPNAVTIAPSGALRPILALRARPTPGPSRMLARPDRRKRVDRLPIHSGRELDRRLVGLLRGRESMVHYSCAYRLRPEGQSVAPPGQIAFRNQNVIYVNILICQLRFICGPGPCLRPIGSETEAYEPSPRQLLGMTRRTRRREGVDVHCAVPACGRDARGQGLPRVEPAGGRGRLDRSRRRGGRVAASTRKNLRGP